MSEVIYEVKQYGGVRPIVNKEPWVSAKAPGTPPSVEALFDIYEAGKSGDGAFEFGLRYVGMSEKEFFDAYEMFVKGEVHPSIATKTFKPIQQTLFKK